MKKVWSVIISALLISSMLLSHSVLAQSEQKGDFTYENRRLHWGK